jgi:hypothetical protein
MYDELDDKELYDKLSQAGLADKLQTSQEWGLLKKAADRIVERAIKAFMVTPATNTQAIIELQQVIKKYKYGLFAEIEMLRNEGEYVFEAAVERQLISPQQGAPVESSTDVKGGYDGT